MTAHDHRLQAALPRQPTACDEALAWFDQIRHLVVRNRLPPKPQVYDVLWAYVRDESHALSYALEVAMARESLDLATVLSLREAHCAPAAAEAPVTADVGALVEAAHQQATSLSQTISAGQNDVADYGRAIADGGAALDTPLDSYGIAALLGELGTATAAMQAANGRLAQELADAAQTARELGDRLGAAERAASIDSLTGVLNRRGTFDRLARLQAEARCNGAPLSLAVFDIDHFKNFNDRFGHALGDKVLAFVAGHVDDRVAPRGGHVGRLGGEEFIALLPGVDAMAATAIIDRVRAELACQVIRNGATGGSLGRVTFSAGIAADRADDDCESLVARADMALYAAKRMGRDRVVPDRG